MKHILASLVLMVLLLPALALGETMDDLVERDGIHYKKFTEVPFTGKITGKVTGVEQGSFKDGKKDGPWVGFKQDGTVWLESTGTYKDGVKVK